MITVDVLLKRWHESRQAGRSISAEELAAAHPELLAELRQRIAKLTASAPVATPLAGNQDATLSIPPAATPGAADRPRPATRANVAAVSNPPARAVVVDSSIKIPGYRITGEIAKGGMGRVHAGFDLTLNREVAIKTLLPGGNAQRFWTEAQITARLPHPSIPPVHALGKLSDGSLFLAMKLVRGRTLDALLKERPDPRHELPGFIHVFEQIAQAVGFAHAEGVIHRDLKPLNVMVGAFGEVQVMDWGLAKQLNAPESAASNPAKQQTAGQTLDGTVLGTPGYMAPEQARGEVVDTRADVFALGAILAAILTGKPAFVGSTVREAVEKAARADLTELTGRLGQCGGDRELIALALKCLAAGVVERPADGRAVATEVAAYRTGVENRLRQAEREQTALLVREKAQRKQRQTVLIAGGLLATVLLVGIAISLWQMFRALHAEAEARAENQAKGVALIAKDAALKAKEAALLAEQKARVKETEAKQLAFLALQNIATDVVQRKFTQGTALTDEDRAFLQNIIVQFDALAGFHENGVKSKVTRAAGRGLTGMLREKLGERTEAVRDFEEAVELFRSVVADDAGKEYQEHFADALDQSGHLHSATGQYQKAEQEFGEAIQAYEQLAFAETTNHSPRLKLATSYMNRSDIFKTQDRLEEAERDIKAALDVQKQLLEEFPELNEVRNRLAGIHSRHAILLERLGRLDQAQSSFDDAVKIAQSLAAKFPRHADYRKHLTTYLINRASLLSRGGRLVEAEQDYTEAIRLARQLAAEFPSILEFRRFLAGAYLLRGSLLTSQARFKEARQDCDQSLELYQQLVAAFPALAEFQLELVQSLTTRGSLQVATGEHEAAEQDFDQAIEVQKKLMVSFPHRSDVWERMGSLFNERADLLQVTGRPEEAKQEYTYALNVYGELAKKQPANYDFLRNTAGIHLNRGKLALEQKDYRGALADFQQVLTMRQQMIKANPRGVGARSELAGGHLAVGVALEKLKELQEAESHYGEALQIYQALLAEFPKHKEFRKDLISTLNNRGLLYLNQQEFAKSASDYEQSQKLLKAFEADLGDQPEYRSSLASSYVNLAAVYFAEKKVAKAKATLLEGRRHHLTALAANPFSPDFRSAYHSHLGIWIQVHATLLQPDEVLKTAALRRDVAWDSANDAYTAATLLVIGMKIVAEHEKLDDSQRAAGKKLYGDAALEMLQTAVRQGYKDAEELRGSDDLEPLRGRDDFKKLVAELEALDSGPDR